MANPILDTNNTVNWENGTNNWRQSDAEWLQARAVVRFANEAAAGTANPVHTADGSVAYFADSPARVSARIGSAWKQILATSYLKVNTDSSTTLTLTHTGASAGLGLGSGGIVTVGSRLDVGTVDTAVSMDATNGRIDLKAVGQSTVSVKNTAGVFAVTGAASFSSTVAVAGNQTVTGTLGVTSTSTFGGAVTMNGGLTIPSGNLGVTGTIAGSSTATFTTSVTSALVKTHASTGIEMTGTTLRNTGTPTTSVDLTTSFLTLRGPTIRMTSDGSAFSSLAGWMQSTAAPGATLAPDGTMYFQTVA